MLFLLIKVDVSRGQGFGSVVLSPAFSQAQAPEFNPWYRPPPKKKQTKLMCLSVLLVANLSLDWFGLVWFKLGKDKLMGENQLRCSLYRSRYVLPTHRNHYRTQVIFFKQQISLLYPHCGNWPNQLKSGKPKTNVHFSLCK